jgi:uncharacterized protein YlxW (UPF0749 family)
MDTKTQPTPVIRAKQMMEIGKPERLQLVLEEIGFIQDEIYRLNQSIKKYQKEVKELTEALRKEVQS